MILKLKHSMLPGMTSTQRGPKRGKTFTLINKETREKILGGNGRTWQPEAFDLLKDERFAFCTAFCGSGKSILQVYLAAYDYIKSDFTQKQLFIVPQSVIADGFISDGGVKHISLRVNGKPYTWQVSHNFCDERLNVLDGLEKWLLNPVGAGYRKLGTEGTLTGGLAVATHQAFNLVWQRLSSSQQGDAIKNLSLRIDEAHHIKGVFDQIDDYSKEQMEALELESTHLGKVCKTILDSKDESSKLHLTTATPYRGDSGIILSPKARNRFKSYFLPWLQHWNTLGIEAFSINYEEYTDDPFDLVIDRIESEPEECHMVVVPATNQKWRQDSEVYSTFLKKLYKIISKDKVLDLVTPSTQKKNKTLLTLEPKNLESGNSRYKVVITCMIGREGLDWVPCSRLHNTAVERSLTLAVQTSGRPLRRYETKTNVAIYNYIPSVGKGLTPDEKRQLFSDRSNGILLGMQWDDLTEQILLPTIPTVSNGSSTEHSVGLQEVFGNSYPKAMSALIKEISSLNIFTSENIDNACSCVIEDYPPQVDCAPAVLLRKLREIVLRRIQRSQPVEIQTKLGLKGIEISFLREAGFDKVIEKFGIDNRAWFAGEHSTETWNELTEIMRSKVLNFRQALGEVTVYFKHAEARGILSEEQINTWIGLRRKENRLGELSEWKKSLIEQIPGWDWDPYSQHKNPEEWVLMAEKLSATNNGSLPNHRWLAKNGYSGLCGAMYKKPELFTKFSQHRKANPPEKFILEIKKRAEENGGVLPLDFQLTKEGHKKWVTAMRKYPELFSDIPRERRFLSMSEHLAEAEKLVSHLGYLPSNGSLQKERKYIALGGAISRFPKEFAKFPQAILRAGTGKLLGFRNGSQAQRRALEIKYGLKLAA